MSGVAAVRRQSQPSPRFAGSSFSIWYRELIRKQTKSKYYEIGCIESVRFVSMKFEPIVQPDYCDLTSGTVFGEGW